MLAFLLGFGSGAAMIPYSIIKEVDPDEAKGSATGAMNFLVFVISALAAPAIGWWLQKLAGGGALTLEVFSKAGGVYVAAIAIAAILAVFLKETGSAVRQGHSALFSSETTYGIPSRSRRGLISRCSSNTTSPPSHLVFFCPASRVGYHRALIRRVILRGARRTRAR